MQEDPIADAYCTVPAFRWKKMFYPELQMPYMPVTKPSKKLLDSAVDEPMESTEDVELAMVGFLS